MQTTQDQLNEYQITFMSIKMKVKFPCKMKLQSQGNNLTQQVAMNDDNKFIFNKQIIIKRDQQTQHFDIDAVLITDRGARYVSGLIKLPLNQLQKSQGQIFVCQLVKCLDQQSFCQIKVNKFKSTKLKKRISISSTLVDLRKQLNLNTNANNIINIDNNNNNNNNNNNRLNQNNKKSSIIFIKQQSAYQSPIIKRLQNNQTKSQIGIKTKSPIITRDWDDNKSKGPAQTLIYKSSFLKSPNRRTIALGSPRLLQQSYHDQFSPNRNNNKNINNNINNNNNNNNDNNNNNNNDNNNNNNDKISLSQSQVYREGYNKLKQKYKRQSQILKSQQNKRIQLQASQNGYKIQIMRLKLKIQEQQRSLTQKNDKIKDLQHNITQINKNNTNIQCLKQQNNNLQYVIQQLKDNINGLNRQNDSLKRLSQEGLKNKQTLINTLKQQLQQSKSNSSKLSLQLSTKSKQYILQLSLLKQQLSSKMSTIQMQKTQIYKLQSQADNKLFQFQKTYQIQKNNHQQKLNQIKQKLSIYERQKKQLQQQIVQDKNDKQNLKQIILKAQYDKKILLQEQKGYKNELLQLKTIKQKHIQLQNQLTFISNDKLALQKQLQLLSQSKQFDITQITQQNQIQLKYYKKQLKQLQCKYQQINKNKIQIESQLQLLSNSLQKSKRNTQSLQNQINQLKSQQQQYKIYLNQLETQNLSYKNQISLINNKFKFNQHTTKNQYNKFTQLLYKNKIQLQAINTKYNQLYDIKTHIEIQYNKNKISLQFNQQKYQKLLTFNKQLQSIHQLSNKQHQITLKQLNQNINKKQSQFKNASVLISKLQFNLLQQKSHLDKYKKQLKLSQQKYTLLQNQHKSKIQQISSNHIKYQQLQIKYTSKQNDYNQQKNNNNLLTNQKNKLQKILQLKYQQIQQNKINYNQLKQQYNNLQKIQLSLREQIKKNNQNYTKLQTKLKYTQKQYNKFKDQLLKTIKLQYSQTPTLSINQKDNKNNKKINKQSQVTSIMRIDINNDSKNNNIDSDNKNKKQSNIVSEVTNIPQSNRQLIANFPQVPSTLKSSDIITQLTQNINLSRQTTFKLIQHNKQLKKQLQNIIKRQQTQSQKYIISQNQLQKDIQHLANQLNQLYIEKQEQIMNYDFQLQDLNKKMYEKDVIIEELTKQCQQLEYVISTLKQDFETNNQQNNKKVNILKVTIYELEQKIQYYKSTLEQQEDNKLQTQQKYQLFKSKTQQQQQQLNKLKITLQSIKQLKNNVQNDLVISIRQRKDLLQKYNELQHKQTQTKQIKQKINLLLQNQQVKNKQSKQFISTLMKQKQTIIKSQLQKSDHILKLQTKILQLKRDLSIYQQQSNKYQSLNSELKQKNKKQLFIFKSQQAQIVDLKNKLNKITQKSQQKQKQIILKNQIISKLDQKYKQLAQKNYKQSLKLHNQIDNKNYQNINLTKQLNSRIILLQARIEENEHNKAKQHHDYIELSEQLLSKNQQQQVLRRQKNIIQKQLQQLRQQYCSLQLRNAQLDERLQIKYSSQEVLSNKISQLQLQIQHQTHINQSKLSQLDHQWLTKYQILIQQEQQKASILQNQNQTIKQQLLQKINQLQYLFKINKNNEIDLIQIKNNYQNKIKKVQNDKLIFIVNKNNQIKKLTQQNKILTENINKSQKALKQTSQLLQNIRKRLVFQQKNRKQLQQRLKSSQTIYTIQIQTWRKKHSQYKQQIQKIYKSIFTNQRQVRKVIQNYIKKVLDQCDNLHIDKITNIIRGLENMIVNAMNNNITTLKV